MQSTISPNRRSNRKSATIATSPNRSNGASNAGSKTENSNDSVELLLEHFQQMINFADTKAQLIMATTALLGTVALSLDRGIIFATFDNHYTLTERAASCFVILDFVCLAISLHLAVAVTMPCILKSKYHNVLFFGSIAQKDEQKFIAEFFGLSENSIQRELAAQVHALARIALQKFTGIRRSLICLKMALFLWFIAQLLQAIS